MHNIQLNDFLLEIFDVIAIVVLVITFAQLNFVHQFALKKLIAIHAIQWHHDGGECISDQRCGIQPLRK